MRNYRKELTDLLVGEIIAQSENMSPDDFVAIAGELWNHQISNDSLLDRARKLADEWDDDC